MRLLGSEAPMLQLFACMVLGDSAAAHPMLDAANQGHGNRPPALRCRVTNTCTSWIALARKDVRHLGLRDVRLGAVP